MVIRRKTRRTLVRRKRLVRKSRPKARRVVKRRSVRSKATPGRRLRTDAFTTRSKKRRTPSKVVSKRTRSTSRPTKRVKRSISSKKRTSVDASPGVNNHSVRPLAQATPMSTEVGRQMVKSLGNIASKSTTPKGPRVRKGGRKAVKFVKTLVKNTRPLRDELVKVAKPIVKDAFLDFTGLSTLNNTLEGAKKFADVTRALIKKDVDQYRKISSTPGKFQKALIADTTQGVKQLMQAQNALSSPPAPMLEITG